MPCLSCRDRILINRTANAYHLPGSILCSPMSGPIRKCSSYIHQNLLLMLRLVKMYQHHRPSLCQRRILTALCVSSLLSIYMGQCLTGDVAFNVFCSLPELRDLCVACSSALSNSGFSFPMRFLQIRLVAHHWKLPVQLQ